MNQAEPESNQSVSSKEVLRDRTPIDRVIEKLSSLDIPAREHFGNYMRHKWRANHKPKTMESSFTSIMLFLQFYKGAGKSDIAERERCDLEAFIEHEQDRGLHISTVKTRMASIIAFLHFLMEQDVLSPLLLKKTIRINDPAASCEVSAE
jgi:site-specific recombinase XerD